MATETTPAEVGLSDLLGRSLLRQAVDDMTKARDKMREMGEADPEVWQYATGIVGMAIYRAVLAERERILRDVAALHMAQAVNNQNHPSAWHDGVDAALDAIRAA